MSALDGHVVAVAGAGGALGPALLRRLTDDGATLALCGRDGERLRALALELELPQARVVVREADLEVDGAAAGWAADVVERFGRIDGLCHLVGGWRGGTPLPDADPGEWDALVGPLVDTVRHVVAAFGGPLAEAPAGRFVLASSTQATAPTAANAAYSAAKAAADAWVLALADAWRDGRATANVVAVKALLTPAMRERSPDKAFTHFAEVEDVAAAFAYLLSGAARHVNGRRLVLA